MAKRRKTIYSGDATVVEQVTNESDNVSTSDNVAVFTQNYNADYSSSDLIGKTFYTNEVLDTFVSYIIPRLEVSELANEDTAEESAGVCLICGGHTSKPSRKICFPCMTKYRDTLYRHLKSAVLDKESTINF